MLKIGDIEIKNRSVLAPLAGISDLPFRMINRRYGCELAFIEMISIHALNYRTPKTMKMLTTAPEDKPLGIQILGRDLDSIRKAVDTIRPMGYDILDLNSACPVKKVAKRGEGAALMKEPKVLESILKLMVEHAGTPVTVKIRAGWDAHSINAAEVARHAEGAGVSAIFIHGRTRTQGYSGSVCYDPIREAKEAVSVPVIASGDMFSAEASKKMMDETGCDGVVMARGALGNPWIFPETAEYLRTGKVPPRPPIGEITEVMHWHLKECVGFYGPHQSVKIFRKFFIWYTKGLRNVKPLRMRAVRATVPEEMSVLIDELREHNLEGEEAPPLTRLPFHTDV
ncbi:tRNA dihydrouridine synthase DusB [Nitrospirota bacterium]